MTNVQQYVAVVKRLRDSLRREQETNARLRATVFDLEIENLSLKKQLDERLDIPQIEDAA